jgi:hypothetical protein
MRHIVIVLAFVAAAFAQRGQQPQQPIPILAYENEVPGDGTYRYSYQTGDGITAEEQGEQRPVPDENGVVEPGTVNRGSFSYTSPEGQLITVTYIADENGFQPTGDHLPTPPPVPLAIQRSLNLIRRVNAARRARAA